MRLDTERMRSCAVGAAGTLSASIMASPDFLRIIAQPATTSRKSSRRLPARSACAADGAGAAGLAGPRLTALGRVSARLKRDWLRRGPDLLRAHLVCCITPHDRF